MALAALVRRYGRPEPGGCGSGDPARRPRRLAVLRRLASSRPRSRCCRRSRGSRCPRPSLADLVVPIGGRRSWPCCSSSSASARTGSARLFGPVMVDLVRRARGARAAPGAAAHPEILRGCRRRYAACVRRRAPVHRVRRAWARSCCAITGAEALYADMGHFGAATDPAGLVLPRLPGADPQLPRPGRAHPRRPDAPSRARSSCWPRAGRGCPLVVLATARHGDRVPGGDLRGVLGVPAGRAAGLAAAAAVRQTSEHEAGQIYVPGGQLGAVRRRARAHPGVPVLRAARHRVRPRGHRRAARAPRRCSSSSPAAGGTGALAAGAGRRSRSAGSS